VGSSYRLFLSRFGKEKYSDFPKNVKSRSKRIIGSSVPTLHPLMSRRSTIDRTDLLYQVEC
jgi:hypothetical protein